MDRFTQLRALVPHGELAPVTRRSGKSELVVASRLACNRYLAEAVQQWAFTSLRTSGWAREFYDTQRSRGRKHHAALRALGNRWLEILWHCLTKAVPLRRARPRRQPQPRPRPFQPADRPCRLKRGLTMVSHLTSTPLMVSGGRSTPKSRRSCCVRPHGPGPGGPVIGRIQRSTKLSRTALRAAVSWFGPERCQVAAAMTSRSPGSAGEGVAGALVGVAGWAGKEVRPRDVLRGPVARVEPVECKYALEAEDSSGDEVRHLVVRIVDVPAVYGLVGVDDVEAVVGEEVVLAEQEVEQGVQPLVFEDVEERVAVSVEVPDPSRLWVVVAVFSVGEVVRAHGNFGSDLGVEKPSPNGGSVAAHGVSDVRRLRGHFRGFRP